MVRLCRWLLKMARRVTGSDAPGKGEDAPPMEKSEQDQVLLLVRPAEQLPVDKSIVTSAAMRIPPALLVLLLGALSTPMVVAWLLGARSVWFTLGSLVFVWVVCPALVCAGWPRAWRIVRDELVRSCRSPSRQLVLAVLSGIALAAVALTVWHFFSEPLGLPPPSTRAKLSGYGLNEADPGTDIFLIAWLTLVNPIMVSHPPMRVATLPPRVTSSPPHPHPSHPRGSPLSCVPLPALSYILSSPPHPPARPLLPRRSSFGACSSCSY